MTTLLARLRDPTWAPEQHDPKANYRTRPVALFEEAADRIEALEAALAPFAQLYRQIIADHGDEWLQDDQGVMRAAASYPVAKDPVRWNAFRRAAEVMAAPVTGGSVLGSGD